MDACIARGGISHVLSQARASLKNPSRPYTPRSTARSLFHGDDYRPGSRPSSSYTVTEQQELQQKQPSRRSGSHGHHKDSSSPSESMLPPRASSSRKQKRAVEPRPRSRSKPEDVDDADPAAGLTASASQLKLVHAPLIPSDDIRAAAGTDDIHGHRGAQPDDSDSDSDSEDHLETSLELPSQDQLHQTYATAQRALEALAAVTDRAKATEAADHVCTALESFLHVSSFFLSSRRSDSTSSFATKSPSSPSSTTLNLVEQLRLELFQAAATVVLERWSHSADCVVALAPSLFELCSASQQHQRCVNDKDSDTDIHVARTTQQAVLLAKLLFMLSKDAANDVVFCNVAYVEAALRILARTSSLLQDVSSATRTSRRHSSSSTNAESDAPVTIDSARLAVPMRMLIYVAGTLKTTSSGEEKMLKLLATNGAIAALGDTLRWRAPRDDSAAAKDIAQCLVQTTGVLRNLSVAKSYHKQFLEALVPARLCALAAAPFVHHLELMGNVARILSKLTLHELPRAQINEHAAVHLRSLMAIVDCSQNTALCLSLSPPPSAHEQQQQQQQQRSESTRVQDALLLRVFFVLGNLCAGNDRNRECVAFECGDGVAVLLHALQFYAQRYAACEPTGTAATNDGDDDSGASAVTASSALSADVLVKLVRVLANVAINADAGARVNRECAQLAALLETLALAQRRGDEELMLNIVSCVTNLSYYSSVASPIDDGNGDRGGVTSFTERHRLEIAALLTPILLDRNDEAVVEAARAFGNLTRFKDVLAAMRTQRALDCLVVLLDHSNREIVYTVCGVLMNAARDEPTRQQLLRVQLDADRGDVRSLLLGLVECAATDDVAMACIACKVLYNLLLPPSVSGGNDSAANGSSFDTHTLRSVVQRLGAAMDAQDARRTAARSMRPSDHNDDDDQAQTHHGNDVNDEDESEGDDSCASDWRELRLVLPQLLRSASAS